MNVQEIQEKFFREGKLIAFPKKLKSRQDLFAYLQEELAKKGSTFTEKEVNAFLAEIYDDFAILRRYLVDYGYLSRDQYGLEYRIEEKSKRPITRYLSNHSFLQYTVTKNKLEDFLCHNLSSH